MRQELPALVSLAERLVASEVPGMLATLIAASGSTYRPLGSIMVSAAGLRAGSVAGGCLDDYVAREGGRLARAREAALLAIATEADAEQDAPIAGCGGAMELLIERLTPVHVSWLNELRTAADSDDPSVSAERIQRDDPVSVSRMWVADAFAAPHSRSVHDDESRTTTLLRYVPAVTRLVIVGAGDDARPLCRMGHSLGWHVTVADCRARMATADRFPDADAVRVAEWEDVVASLPLGINKAIVLMTHNLGDDARVLSLIGDRALGYVGVLGPGERRARLSCRDGSPVATTRLATELRGPVGLDLGDRSSEGIAVAIVAEILSIFNRRSAQPLSALRPRL